MHYPTPLFPIIVAKLFGGNGQGASVTPASVLTALEGMDSEQQSDARAAIGATDAATSIPDNVKQALLACFADVAWADDQGQTHYDALEAALYPLDSISAVFTPGTHVVYDTDSLDSLKPYLTVTATYQGGQTATVASSNYTLAGTLTAGTSTITVSYGGKTATFDVVVSTHVLYSLENRSFSNESIDTGVVLLDEDRDFSIAFDASITSNPTSGNSSQMRLAIMINQAGDNFAFSFGKGSATASTYTATWYGNYKTMSATSTGRIRFVLTHTKNSGMLVAKSRKDTAVAVSDTISGTFVATNRSFKFGGSGAQLLPTGTINKAIVYDYAMTDAEVNTFLGLQVIA